MMDMAMLIGENRPDVHGHTIPSGVQQGSVVIESAKGASQWMTLVVSSGVYNPLRGTCTVNCIYCYGYGGFCVVANPFAVPVTLTTPLHANATYSDGNVHDYTTSSSWRSDNTSVATVGTSTGVVTGQASGSLNAYATFPSLVVTTGQVCSGGMPVCPTAAPSLGAPGSVTPKISAITPAEGLIGATTSVTISGTGFGSSPTVSAGTGITFTYTSRNNTQIVANFVVASSATAGNHALTVTNTSVTPNLTSASVNFYVQVPTMVTAPAPTVHTFTNQIATHCDGSAIEPNPTALRWGTEDCILYYTLKDQNSPTANTISYPDLTVSEAFTWKSGYTQLPTPFTDIGLTDGTFGDEYSVFSTSGPIPTNFQQDFLQSYVIKNIDNNQTWTVRQNCIRWSGATVTITDVTTNPSSCN